MPSPYSVDLRIRVVNSIQNGMSHDEASEFFQVGTAKVKRWAYRYRDKGHVLSRSGYQKGHSHKIIDEEKFIKLIRADPSRTSA